jgi:hypothetical protein
MAHIDEHEILQRLQDPATKRKAFEQYLDQATAV